MIVVLVLLAGYAVFIALLYFMQERLIFPGARASHLLYHRSRYNSCDTLGSGGQLQGWLTPGCADASNKVALFFGGNGQDVCEMQPIFERLAVEKTYAFNYQGYGLSEGQPTEAALYEDALLIYGKVQKDNPQKNVVLIGQSLGTAVAGHVATQRNAQKLVLITPLSSVADLVRCRLKRTFPIRLLKHKFDLALHAKRISCDTLLIVAERDEVIPNRHSLKTFHEIIGAKSLSVIDNAGHNTIYADGSTVLAINRFLNAGS